jgi:F0F1-type ATP synthase gamma subunit
MEKQLTTLYQNYEIIYTKMYTDYDILEIGCGEMGMEELRKLDTECEDYFNKLLDEKGYKNLEEIEKVLIEFYIRFTFRLLHVYG